MKHLAQTMLVVCLWAWGVSAQLAYYVDENGKRIYVNANPKPEPKPEPAKSPKKAKPAAKQIPSTASKKPSPFDVPKQVQASAVPAASLTPTAPPPVVDAVIQDAAKRHEVDPELVKAIVRVESNFNPRAVSNKGAMGLMQLVPGTAMRFGAGNVFNPVENVDAGVRYLKYLLGLFGGDLKLSLAAYNAGEKAVERHGGIPPYRETQDYVKKIGDVYSMLHPQRPAGGPQRIVRTLDENGRVLYTNMP